MTTIGYARVSTTDQDLSIQEAALRAAGCEVLRSEKRSGTTTEGREELQTILDFLRPGDCLMVTRVDRLARSIGDLQDIVRALRAKGASLKATEQPIDTSTAAGKCFLDMLGGVCGVRNQPQARAAAGRDREGQGEGRVQGPTSFDRRGTGARTARAGSGGLARSRRLWGSRGRASTGPSAQHSP
jgi:DNA invertase Pin-like site-specific DNA recombinase